MKWGHLVYLSNGPVLLIRAEEKRVLFGFWRGKRLREIAPRLKAGEDVLIAAHGNSLRAIVKLLFSVPDDQIVGVEIPTGNPLEIDLDADLKPVAARYLDEGRAQALPPIA